MALPPESRPIDPRFAAPGPEDFTLRCGTLGALTYLVFGILFAGAFFLAATLIHRNGAALPLFAVLSLLFVLAGGIVFFTLGLNLVRTRLEVRGGILSATRISGGSARSRTGTSSRSLRTRTPGRRSATGWRCACTTGC